MLNLLAADERAADVTEKFIKLVSERFKAVEVLRKLSTRNG
jgi:hypothetical protein